MVNIDITLTCDNCEEKEKMHYSSEREYRDAKPFIQMGWGKSNFGEDGITKFLCPKCRTKYYNAWRRRNPDMHMCATV